MVLLRRLRGTVRRLATRGTLQRERKDIAETNGEGLDVFGAPTLTVLPQAPVQPISGRDRRLLPQGVETSEVIVTFSPDELRTEEDAGSGADVLIHTPKGGTPRRYVVQRSEDWAEIAGHYRVFASRERSG